ncbi:transcription factor bHLH128-like isoform X1 [Zingiber officinale]|uniref:transcription factor bHLH128-like isoform X1 n=1 Tax=Zingiber officinale TaxID=94328 RepID=UPI001C4C9AFE|nr:transcription factor bHLH128-like isoform X1 [Zingiber officinale]
MSRSPATADGKESGLDRYGAPSRSLLGEADAAAPSIGQMSETSFSAPRGSYGEGGAEFSAKVSGGGSALLRHSSSPAGFFSQLLMDDAAEIRSYPQASNDSVHPMTSRHLRSQWNFSRNRLSQISEMCIPEVGDSVNCSSSSDEAAGHATNSYISGNFQLSSWTDSNSVMFSAACDQRLKDNNGDRLGSFSRIDSQFSLPSTSLEISNVENYLQLQQESIPCKVRAKRGCATHPRSIAERERRNRISKRLHKLQGLVPSMDKQTSTSDMLELAIQYIKELRSQVQKLKQERADCTCTSKQLVA